MKGWDRLRYLVICLVTVVWAVNFVGAAFFTNYKSDPAINTVFMTIVGSLFVGGELIKKYKGTQSGIEKETDTKSEKDPAP